MARTRAIITGVTGQGGSFLAEDLVGEGTEVIGLARRSSLPNTSRISHLLGHHNFLLVEGDVTDAMCMQRLVNNALDGCETLYVYNLAAQSHVAVSFREPSHTTDVVYGGTLNLLEAIRNSSSPEKIRFVTASSSEMFGSAFSVLEPGSEFFQDEKTPFHPCSPYAIAKLAAHHLVNVYRNSYGLFASTAIMFNYESERRGEQFVTRKITKHLGKVAQKEKCEKLKLGNLTAKRDWSYARDTMRGLQKIVTHAVADDFVLGSGDTHSVEDFLHACLAFIGISSANASEYYEIDPELFRPSEVDFLKSRPTKANRELGWKSETGFQDLVRIMMEHDIGNK